MTILLKGWFCLLVELHRKRSAPFWKPSLIRNFCSSWPGSQSYVVWIWSKTNIFPSISLRLGYSPIRGPLFDPSAEMKPGPSRHRPMARASDKFQTFKHGLKNNNIFADNCAKLQNSVCMSVCLSFCLSSCLFICLFVCLSVFLSVCLSVFEIRFPRCFAACRIFWKITGFRWPKGFSLKTVLLFWRPAHGPPCSV